MNGYLLIASPALFIITAAFFFEVKESLANANYQWLKKLVLVLLIGLPIRYCIERVKPFELKSSKPHWVTELKNWSERNNQKVVLLGCKAPIETMFYTQAIAYETIPEVKTIIEMQHLGYKVFINELARPKKEIRDLKGVNFISLKYSDF